MSRSLDLPEEANLWDVSAAPTIVMTQRGARQGFQRMLRSKGVEVRRAGGPGAGGGGLALGRPCCRRPAQR
jgi:riboflavin biosynthesis pyrimidine reductase